MAECLPIAFGQGGGASYEYDGDGLRIQKVDVAGTINHVHDLNRPYSHVIAEADANGTFGAEYVWGHDGDLLQMKRGGQVYYYLHDALGSVRALTNAAGQVVNRYDYFAYRATVEADLRFAICDLRFAISTLSVSFFAGLFFQHGGQQSDETRKTPPP
jgi:hypothetical protein